MNKSLRLLTALLVFSSAVAASDTNLWQPYRITPRSGAQHVDLSNSWQLAWTDAAVTNPGDLAAAKWIKARVPGSVQWSLYDTGEYPHPYRNLNSKQYTWVDEKVWYYRTRFEAAPREGYAFLCFDGIDYYARVWLNGTELGRHEGIFGGPSIEVMKLLRPSGANDLVVEVRAANWGVKKTWDAWKPGRVVLPWVLGGRVGAEAFFPLGMWRPVRLEFAGPVHLERPRLITTKATPQEASLTFETEVLAGTHSLLSELHPWNNTIFRGYRDPLEQPLVEGSYSIGVELTPKGGGAAIRQQFPLQLHQGRNWARKTLAIAQPRLWWPNGMGKPELYGVRVSLLRDGKPVDAAEFDFGIRTFETSRTAGLQTQDRWAQWQFAVNGKKFFAKGMNWMPADLLLDLPAARYRWLLGMARDQGIKLIRIWGGGLIETDDFYRAADEFGLLIWQDLPLGNMDTPQWPQDVWEAQVVSNIFRLRNHPSLAIWCGGNEFNPYSTGNAATMAISERSVRDFDGTRPFLRTSPDGGSIHTYPNMDATWYSRLYAEVPFIAETGIHSIPSAANMREVVAPAELERRLEGLFTKPFAESHPDFVHHFVEFTGEHVGRMMSRVSHMDDVSAPTFEALAEASQVAAGEFYQIVSDAMQSNYPVTGGLLPWAFKRPWPAVGVMMVDGLGQPTAPYYFLKRTYEPVHVAVALPWTLWATGETVPVSVRVINAGGAASLRASVDVLDAKLHSVWRRTSTVTVAAGPSVAKADLGKFEIPAAFRNRFFFLVAEVRDPAGALVSRSVYWPRCLEVLEDRDAREKYRAKPQPIPVLDKGPWMRPQVRAVETQLQADPAVKLQRGADGIATAHLHIRNTGTAPAVMASLQLEGARANLWVSDNFFWLAAGESRDLQIRVAWREPAQSGAALTLRAWNAGAVTVKVAE